MKDLHILAAVIVGVLSVARTARLIVWDEYPPMMWLRDQWDMRVTNGWNKLVHCAFCATPYLAVGMALWFWAAYSEDSGVGLKIWWIVNGVWGLSYVSAIVVAYDQPEE